MNRFEKIRENQKLVLMLARNLPQGTYVQIVQAMKATESILGVLEGLLQAGDTSGSKDTIIASLEAQLDAANAKLETMVAELRAGQSPKKRQAKKNEDPETSLDSDNGEDEE